jgi:hypothetical protein
MKAYATLSRRCYAADLNQIWGHTALHIIKELVVKVYVK